MILYNARRTLRGILPCALVVKEAIGALLEFLCDILGFFVPLEPGLVLLVKPPTLVFQRLSGQVLLRRSLLVVKNVKQSVGVYPRVQPRVIEYGQWLCGESRTSLRHRHIGTICSRDVGFKSAGVAQLTRLHQAQG